MGVDVFILRRRGVEEGPYSEEEILDALDASEVSPDDWCRLGRSGELRRVGDLFERVVGGEGEEGSKAERGMGMGEDVESVEDVEGLGGGEDEEEDEEEHEHEDEHDYDYDYEEEDGEEDGEERVLYEGVPSVFGYGWALGVAGGVLVAGYWLGRFGVGWVVGGLGLGLLLVVRVLLHRAAREYVVTTERVEARIGLVAPKGRCLWLRDLESIRLHRAGLLGWLGVGTVIFCGGEKGEEVVFERIARVRRVIGLVRERQRQRVGR